ncbi:MAG: PKD domain-containing protein [Kangiellaceae bacterium]|jgi:hypothetical protein|nr:PKD domain-containing protein [Kangiellaceae bacterium]
MIRQLMLVLIISISLVGKLEANTIVSLEQIPAKQKPLSVQFKSQVRLAPTYQLDPFDANSLAKAAMSDNKPGPYMFAKPYEKEASYDQYGQWQDVGDWSVWQLHLSADGSKSLNVGFTDVFLPHQAKLYVYTLDGAKAAIFGEEYNRDHGQLWSPVFEGSELIIEVNVPKALKGYTKFRLKNIHQGFRSMSGNDLKNDESGICNNDVVCSVGDPWRDEIRSVARIAISSPRGTGLCTGSLVNNTSNNNRPYFLSANHCGITDTTAPSMVFYWNYENSVCDARPNTGSLTQFSSGSTFRAAHEPSDMALVEIDDRPDLGLNLHWAGWDNSDTIPTGVVGIHHPAGDVKKISFDTDALTITDYSSNVESRNSTHLRVGNWEDGTTEGGSSGSAIWNSNKHIVGTLHGGAASCNAPDAPDWYGRVAMQWLGGNTTATQLKAWLDPLNTNVSSLDGIDGCDAPTSSVSLSSGAISLGGSVTATASAQGGSGTGYTYSWDFNNDGVEDATGASVDYQYNYLYESNVRVTVTDGANCEGVGSAAIVVANNGDEIFTSDGTLPAEWSAVSGTSADWFMTNSQSYEGGSSIQSGDIADDQESSIEVTHNFTEATGNFIAFASKVSSESGYDFLNFYIDGEQVLARSGEADWATHYFAVEPGSHTFRWSYRKDESVSNGSDAAWIDGVTGIPVTASGNTGGGDSGGGNTGGDTGGDSGGDRSSSSGGGSMTWLVLMLMVFANLRRRVTL